MNTIIEVQNKADQIAQLVFVLYQHSQHCSEFSQIRSAILNHYQEALRYLNRSFEAIHQQYPDSKFDSISRSPLNKPNAIDFLMPDIEFRILQQIIKDLLIHIDQLAFIVRRDASLDARFHMKLYAQAMTELFDLQTRYIYPYHPNLIPDHLKQANFEDKLFFFNQ